MWDNNNDLYDLCSRHWIVETRKPTGFRCAEYLATMNEKRYVYSSLEENHLENKKRER